MKIFQERTFSELRYYSLSQSASCWQKTSSHTELEAGGLKDDGEQFAGMYMYAGWDSREFAQTPLFAVQCVIVIDSQPTPYVHAELFQGVQTNPCFSRTEHFVFTPCANACS